MILMALIGECDSEADSFHFAMTHELGPSKVRRVYVGFVSDMTERLRRLRLEATARLSDEFVTLVVGVNTPQEVAELRSMGAFVCHQHGPLGDIYDDIAIQSHDLVISSNEERPSHALDALEAYSECYVRRREMRKAKGAA